MGITPRQRQRAAVESLEPALQELRTRGLAVRGIDDVPSLPADPESLEVLAGWVPRVEDPLAQRWLVEAIRRTGWSFGAGSLLRNYMDVHPEVRWELGHTICQLCVEGDDDAIADLACNQDLGNDRAMLVQALGKLATHRSVETLVKLLSDISMSGLALRALRTSRADIDPRVVEPLLRDPDPDVQKEAEMLLRALNRTRP